MTRFDLSEVTHFVNDLESRFGCCENVEDEHGEGTDCASFDGMLHMFALCCCEFRENLAKWAREIFSGRIKFEEEVEAVWIARGHELIERGQVLLAQSAVTDSPCFEMSGETALKAALNDLKELLDPWVRPSLAVGPSARLGLPMDSEEEEKARAILASLPPLPSDWQPATAQQRKRFAQMRTK